MKKIGITGGIGSGKSTAAKLFAMLGVPVYNADNRSKYLLENKAEVVAQVRRIFGEDAYLPDGRANRVYIASQVFSDKEKLRQLEAVTHPAVSEDFAEWVSNMNSKAPFVLKEAALLFEAGTYKDLDGVILILSPEELRIQRVMKRDNLSRQEVQKRIANQWPDEQKLPLARYIIHDDEVQLLMPQVMALYEKLCAE